MGLLKGVYMVSYSFFKYLYCFVIFIALPSTSEALFCQENWLNGVILTAAIPGGAQIECNTLNYFYYNNPYDSVFYMMTNGALNPQYIGKAESGLDSRYGGPANSKRNAMCGYLGLASPCNPNMCVIYTPYPASCENYFLQTVFINNAVGNQSLKCDPAVAGNFVTQEFVYIANSILCSPVELRIDDDDLC